MKTFKEFISEEINPPAIKFDSNLPEYYSHFYYLMRVIIDSKSLGPARAEPLAAIKYCTKNLPQSISQANAWRSDYISAEKLVEYIAKGKIELNEIGYYSFSDRKRPIGFTSTNRSTMVIKKEIKGISSFKALTLLLQQIVNSLEDIIIHYKYIPLSPELLSKLEGKFGVFNEAAETGVFSLQVIKEKLVDPVLAESPKEAKKALKQFLSFYEKAYKAYPYALIETPNNREHEAEVLVPGPISLNKENLKWIREVNLNVVSAESLESSLRKNLKDIIKVWSDKPKEDLEKALQILKENPKIKLQLRTGNQAYNTGKQIVFGIRFMKPDEEFFDFLVRENGKTEWDE